jgi:predicted ABC-type ATPase
MSAAEDRLDPKLHSAIQKRISRLYLDHPSHRHPKAILLAGQPGAGKTFSREEAVKTLKKDAVVIDTDELRKFHPRYVSHSYDDPKTSASKVHYDASLWAKELWALAMDGRKNLIVDGTLSNPERAEKLCRELKDRGYDVEVRALAVNREVSWKRVTERYEKALKAKESGGNIVPRWVGKDIHDKAYEGMPKSVAGIEKDGLADRIKISDEYGKLLHMTNAENLKSHGASEAIEKGRERVRLRSDVKQPHTPSSYGTTKGAAMIKKM